MQRVNEYRFYELGQKIKAISGIESATIYAEVWFPLWEARMELMRLKQDAVAFRISLPVVDRVIEAITAIVPEKFQEAIQKQPDVSSPAVTVGVDYYELRESLREFEPVLAAECKALDTYVISQKRGYTTADLIERSEVMLAPEVWTILEESIVNDLRSAGRCLAFDTPTASGFHVLRAVEAVMALYFKHVTGRELKKRHRNWGAYLLKLKKEPQVNVRIVGALEHVKENYRNPITHPEVTLTESQAIMVFGLSLSVIELMADIIINTPPMLTGMEQAKAIEVLATTTPADDF